MALSNPLSLSDLIVDVEQAGTDPLDRVATAVALADDLGVTGDNLVGHFVDAARQSGLSWTQIGTVLGVSKQAAQQRFVPRGEVTTDSFLATAPALRYTARAKKVVERAGREARRRNDSWTGTEHLLLGLLEDGSSPDGGGIGVKVIESLGASLAGVRQKTRKELGAPGQAPTSEAPLTPRALKALDLAMREALLFWHNYVGTEHLLLGLIGVEDGVAGTVLASFGISLESAREETRRRIANGTGATATRPRRDRNLGALVVEVARFADIKAAGDALLAGDRFLADLRPGDAALRRRAVDHLSGVVYALGGRMEMVGDRALVGVPAEETLTVEERQKFEAFVAQ